MNHNWLTLMKWSCAGMLLLGLTLAAGCGDGAKVAPPVAVEEGGADDPLTMSNEKPAKLPN